MIYGYARVSTKGQAKDGNGLEGQEKLLKQFGAEKIYFDSFTGTKANRPELDKLMKVLKEGDTLVVTKLDRIARSVIHGVTLINALIERNITVDIINLGKMDNSPTGKLIRNVFLAFAEFERDMIVERTAEGKEIAKLSADFKEGRPKIYNSKQMDHALSLLSDHSYKEVEQITGISKSTLIRARRKIVK